MVNTSLNIAHWINEHSLDLAYAESTFRKQMADTVHVNAFIFGHTFPFLFIWQWKSSCLKLVMQFID